MKYQIIRNSLNQVKDIFNQLNTQLQTIEVENTQIDQTQLEEIQNRLKIQYESHFKQTEQDKETYQTKIDAKMDRFRLDIIDKLKMLQQMINQCISIQNKQEERIFQLEQQLKNEYTKQDSQKQLDINFDELISKKIIN